MKPRTSCLELFMHEIPIAFFFDLARAGNNIAARIAMIAMTTNSSISVKAILVTRQPVSREEGARASSFDFANMNTIWPRTTLLAL